ncbi:hypothetical protein ACOSP7_006812 [Xanthoceras sorbifolium]
MAKAFVSNIVKLHGFPKSIVSDRDKIFISSFWTNLFKLQGIELKMSSSYHPQTDGQTEVVNRTLEQYLCCFIGYQPRKWMDCLYSATKTTPFKVVYGVSPPGFLLYVPGTTQVQAVEEYIHDRTAVIKELRHHLTLAQERMKKRREVQFQAGDFVYLKLHPYRQTSMAFRSSMKLSPLFFGPFEILEKIGQVAYRLALPYGAQIHDVVHVSLLRKHLGDRPPAVPSLPPVSDESSILPIPETILDRRIIQKGKYRPHTEVLVKWAGASIEDATSGELMEVFTNLP